MEEHYGVLSEIGAGKTKDKGKWVYLSYITINGTIIKDVYIAAGMQTILDSQMKRSGEIKIWITKWFFRKVIIGITQSDGQTYRQSAASSLTLALAPIIVLLFIVINSNERMMSYHVVLLLFCIACSAPSVLYYLKLKKIPSDHTF